MVEWKVGAVTPQAKSCENHRSAAELPDRAGDFPQMWKGARSHWLERPTSTTTCSPTRPIAFHHGSQPLAAFDGSLAVVQPLWVQATSGVPPMIEPVAGTLAWTTQRTIRSSLSQTIHPSLPRRVLHNPHCFLWMMEKGHIHGPASSCYAVRTPVIRPALLT